jgi:hypothetical protein
MAMVPLREWSTPIFTVSPLEEVLSLVFLPLLWHPAKKILEAARNKEESTRVVFICVK